jgi:hypothetical protein
MNAILKHQTINTIQSTIQDVRYMVEPVVSDPTKLTLLTRIYDYFDALSQASYNAWEKAGKPYRE